MSLLSDTSQVNHTDQEFNYHITRFSACDRQQVFSTSGRVNIVTSTPVRPGTRTATDKDSFLPCKDHQTTKLYIKTCESVFYFSNSRRSCHKDDYQLQVKFWLIILQ